MNKLLTILITSILTAISCTNLDEVWAELRPQFGRQINDKGLP